MLFSRQQIAREDADGVISGGNVSGEAEMQKLNVNRLSLFIQLSSLGPGRKYQFSVSSVITF